jgi:hypothetical protein
MLMVKRKVAAVSVATVLGMGALAPLAFAGGYCPPPPPPPEEKAKCNAGNGNGSESTVDTGHCTNGDPGNSWNAGNRGGDETSFPGSVLNPGGNNAP